MLPSYTDRASSSGSSQPSGSRPISHSQKVNDSLYKFDSALSSPTMQVLFFHGLQFENHAETHLCILTWESEDGSCIWPEKWLVEDFPGAQILYVSYDAVVRTRSYSNGSIDMYVIGENLVSDLMQAGVGQIPNCPLIMVGHCFGGVVIKQLCVKAHQQLMDKQLRVFLDNVKGIFYYSTPHHGSYIFEKLGDVKHPLWSYFQVLSKDGGRLNHEFNRLCTDHSWKIHALGASLPVQSGLFKGLVVVEESSARVGHFSVRAADHFGICKPENKLSSGYCSLKRLLDNIASDIAGAAKVVAPVHQCNGLPNYPIGLTERAKEVHEILKNAAIIGIVGMGGIGKTTVAKEVFNNISGEFEYTCFVDNVKGIKSHELDHWLRNQFVHAGSEGGGNPIQWHQLQGKKTLIGMDDVDSENQLKALPNLRMLGSGSRLIITSRDHGVLDYFANHVIYDVEFLSFEEAKELFCQHAFQQGGIPDSLMGKHNLLEENVKKVVQKCDGLPLTLEVIGSYLRGHKTNPRVWKDTIDKLGKAQPINGLRKDRVWALTLRVSYEALSPELQEMFIQAGTYFFALPVEQALAAWSTACGNSDIGWANLLSTSMVKEVVNRKVNQLLCALVECREVWVHEQLRDLARNLSKGAMIETLVGGPYSGSDLKNAIAVEAHTSGLRLKCPFFRIQPKLSLEWVDKLEKLKYLDLDHIVHEGSRSTVLRNLSLLRWHSSFQLLLPFNLEYMDNLAVLDLRYWEIPEESFEALGKLSNLRLLSLHMIRGLARLPEDFGDLSELRRLELGDVGLTTLPHSFGNLSAMEHLILAHMKELVELPESFGNLSSLATLVLSNCNKLSSLPESFGRLQWLTELQIINCSQLNCLQPTEVYRLDLRENVSSLTSLFLKGCDSLQRLPASLGLLSCLEKLELRSCGRLKTLPENIGEFQALKRLIIHENDHLEALPDSFGNLSALQELELENCLKLQRLSDNFGQLRALQKLTINGTYLDALSDDFGNLPSLTTLRICRCPRFERLPESFSLLSSLQELELHNCRQLQSLPDNFGQLSALKTLSIKGADHLESLPDSLGDLSSLEELFIGASILQRIPESIGQLHALRKVSLVAQKLSTIPEELGDLPESLDRIPSVRILVLLGCNGCESLTDGLRNLLPANGYRSTETSRPEVGHSSQTACTNGMWLHINDCPFLDDSPLQSLGFIEADHPDFGPEGDDIFPHYGTWYQRESNRLDE